MAQALNAALRRALARDITRAESTRPADRKQLTKRLANYDDARANTMRIGISGTPGVGKSTFIESFGLYLARQHQRNLAVLAVDPSSPVRGGSLLGDKTRMEELSREENVFIRPAPTRGYLGGLARATRHSAWLCEMAGYDTILIETVGVGQSEHDVARLVDVFVVLLQSGAGDALQGIKRGILELADIVAVNKAEGANKIHAKNTAAEYREAFKLTRPELAERIFLCSALKAQGIAEIWTSIKDTHADWQSKGTLITRRREQNALYLQDELRQLMESRFSENKSLRILRSNQEALIRSGEVSVQLAAQTLINAFAKQQGKSS